MTIDELLPDYIEVAGWTWQRDELPPIARQTALEAARAAYEHCAKWMDASDKPDDAAIFRGFAKELG